MKKIKIITLILFTSLFFTFCGGEGYPSMQLYKYSMPKYKVEKELNRIIKVETDTIPLKWKEFCTPFEFMDDRFIYFRKNPEEILRLSFVGDSSIWVSENSCELRLFDWFDGSKWVRDFDIKSKDRKRIVRRLESEILSKMIYNYDK